MRSVSYRLADFENKKLVIPIGFVGENEFTKVNIDCQRVFKDHPSAVATLSVVPPSGDDYPAIVTRDGDIVTWEVTASDLVYDGFGEIQLTFTDGTKIGKDYKARTHIEDSIAGSGTAPTPIQNWIDSANEKLAAVEEATQEAEYAASHPPRVGSTGYWETWNAETEQYVATSTKAKGEDGDPGHSPVITANKNGKTTVLYSDGQQIAQIVDGNDGNPGDPTTLIDDTAGTGVTNKTLSADKITTEFGSVLSDIQGKADSIINTATGNPVVFNDGRNLPIKSMLIQFNPKQSGSGDPSPLNVRDFQLWNGLTVYNSGADTSNPTETDIVFSSDVCGGELEVVSGSLKVKYGIFDLGSISWNRSSADHKFYGDVPQYLQSNNNVFYSNKYKFDGVGNSERGFYGDDLTFRYYYDGTNVAYQIYVHDDRFNTVSDFTQAVQGTYIVYPLSTPQETQITPVQITLLNGNNTVWADSDGNIEIAYQADTNIYIRGNIVKDVKVDGVSVVQDGIANINNVKFVLHDECEPGSLYGDITKGIHINSNNFTRYRTKNIYEIKDADVSLTVQFSANDVRNISKIALIRYKSDFTEMKIIEVSSLDNAHRASFAPDNSYPIIKLLVYHNNGVYSFNGVDVYANGGIEKIYHPNIENPEYDSITFNYSLSRKRMASGRLLLPPNYKTVGEKVPLVVYVHGSGGLVFWDSKIYDTTRMGECFRYLNNEGFAVFDCHPLSQDISIPAYDLYNPFQIPLSIMSYIEGIKYVCSRYNVDINNVALLCKSQGGNIGHWATIETEFPFKAVGLFCPTTDPVLQKTNIIFYNSYCRQLLLDLIDFDGTSTEKEAFVTSGSLDNADVQSFIAKNKGLFVALMPFAKGTTNVGSVDDLCQGGFGTLTQTPQWMLDLGLPARETEYDLIPEFAENDNYVRIGQRPVRFWCAIDDAQTSTYGNYAIYRYLLNGGSDAEFTFLQIGTGGHNAMDESNLAVKTSGTTSLGIAYSNIPVAYVQVAAFFHRYM